MSLEEIEARLAHTTDRVGSTVGDMEFDTHARADVMWLIDEVRRLRKDNAVLMATGRKAVTSYGDPYHETALVYLGKLVGVASADLPGGNRGIV